MSEKLKELLNQQDKHLFDQVAHRKMERKSFWSGALIFAMPFGIFVQVGLNMSLFGGTLVALALVAGMAGIIAFFFYGFRAHLTRAPYDLSLRRIAGKLYSLYKHTPDPIFRQLYDMSENNQHTAAFWEQVEGVVDEELNKVLVAGRTTHPFDEEVEVALPEHEEASLALNWGQRHRGHI